MNPLTLPTIPKTNPRLAPLAFRPSTAINNPDWILCSELSEQYWVVLSKVDFPAQTYCQAHSVYTTFTWDNINRKKLGAKESFKYRSAVEHYYDQIKAALKLFTISSILKTNSRLAPLRFRPSRAINNPDWILCSELSEQYWVVLSKVDFPAHTYCQAYSVYTAFVWDNINRNELGAREERKYRPAVELYHDRIKAALELFIMA